MCNKTLAQHVDYTMIPNDLANVCWMQCMVSLKQHAHTPLTLLRSSTRTIFWGSATDVKCSTSVEFCVA